MLCLCLVVFPINYKIIASFRLLDICVVILFIFFLMTNPKVNRTLLLPLFFAIFFFSLSNMIGTLKNASIELVKLGFIYKYLFIFIIPWMVVSIVKTKEQIKVVNWLLLINFILLSSWTYIYQFLLVSGYIRGNFRPSFPFSNDYMYSDAHLYSSYLAFFLIVYIFYLRRFFNHKIIISVLIVINGTIGLLLTGSRTGVVLVVLSFFLYCIYSFSNLFSIKKRLKIKRNSIIYSVIFSFVIIILLIFIVPYIDEFILKNKILIERAFEFNLTDDQSSLGRIQKLMIGIEDAQYSGFLLGVGLHSSLIWYDGLFAILIAHGGILFILSIFIFYYIIIKKAYLKSLNQKDFLLFLMMIVLYLASNLITEYVFVSRNAFPILVELSILYASILNNKEQRKEENKKMN